MTRLPLAATLAAILLAILVLGGCGGGDGISHDDGNPLDTGTISGRVVRADAPTSGISGASVIVRSETGSPLGVATTSTTGAFTVRGIPVGNQTIVVDTIGEPTYGEQTVTGVPVQKDLTTSVMVTVLRVDAPAPSVLDLTPEEVEVDLNGSATFTASVRTSSGSLAVTPTFYVTGGVGVVSYDASTKKVIFTATREGTGKLRAVCGTVEAESDITVVEAGSPDVSSFLVAPMSLPATGGDVSITVAVTDGDGVKTVQAEIFRPDTTSYRITLPLVLGTQETYRATTELPANNNPYGTDGKQNPQTYRVQYIVTDWANQVSTTPTNEFVTITVAGLQVPPSPE
ncbi:MAG: carboxypeptidase-like regulatory domain-containing protein [Armatimonadia bacterium]